MFLGDSLISHTDIVSQDKSTELDPVNFDHYEAYIKTQYRLWFGEDINGEFTISYQALDGALFSEVASLTIEILPVNDPPTISNILNQSIDEDENFVYYLNAVDVDSEALEFSVDGIDYANVTIDGQTLSVIPDQDYNGSLTINVHVYDGEYSDSEQFILDVLPVNDSPVLDEIANQNSLEDELKEHFTLITQERFEEAQEKVKFVIHSLVQMMDEATAIVGFFEKWDEVKRVKRDIKRTVIEEFDDLDLVKPVTDRFMELAEVKFK